MQLYSPVAARQPAAARDSDPRSTHTGWCTMARLLAQFCGAILATVVMVNAVAGAAPKPNFLFMRASLLPSAGACCAAGADNFARLPP